MEIGLVKRENIRKKRLKRPLKDTAMLNVSRNVLEDIIEDRLEVGENLCGFIPFHNERDRVGRVIKECSLPLIKNPINRTFAASEKNLSREPSSQSIKFLIKSKRIPLICPIADYTPPVGAYNITPSWIKRSFLKITPKGKLSEKTFDTEKKAKPFKDEYIQKNEQSLKKVASLDSKLKVKILPRKKGIWEAIKIAELPLSKDYTIEESKQIVNRYDSNIKNSIKGLRENLLSLEKYLK
ncbi:hypothetical protein SteCoe_21579 [Stentor coeruleus]|uniref:Uncharacterized protein n=1 Tax=Stentor coeruleus TaxID=5963 RepID=A0A1R2BP93_9CILI|nr:hypothetical protein SteCoe_21579 [Stentor coeruleus]